MSWGATAKVIVVPIASILLVFVLWDLIIRGFAVDPFVAPSPLDALAAVRDGWSEIWPLTFATVRETVYGFAIGAALGFVLAVLMAQARVVQNLIYPVLITSQAVPVIALAAPLVLLLGFGLGPKIVIVAWIVFFPVAVSVLDGFANVDRDLINLAHVMGGSRWRVFLLIRIPATVAPLFSGLKIGATYAVTGAIIGELVASTGQSLAGYQRTANGNLDTAAVWGTTLVMTAIGIGWFLLVVLVEHVATPWRYRATRRRLRFRQAPNAPENAQ
ncbi:MAG: ABC transporter permease [Gaiellales bacterium]